MSSFLLRNARLVELGTRPRPRRARRRPGARGPGLRDRPGARAPAGDARVRRRGPLADPRPVGPARPPRPVDGLLAAARPRARSGRPRRRPRWWPSGSSRCPTSRSSAGGTGSPAGTATRPSPSSTGRPGDAGHPDQRRRPPRLAQHHRPDRAGAAGPRQGRLRARVVRGVLPAGHARRQRRHLARGVPAHARGRRRDGRRPASSTSSSAAARRSGPSGSPRARTCCASGWRRTPTAWTP